MRRSFCRLLASFLTMALVLSAWAQATAPAAAASPSSIGKERLDQLLAPIALYPDSLLSQVLMASTYPADVSLAVKWSKSHPEDKGDAAVIKAANQPWEASVQSLVAFPQVLATMGEKPDWVQDLGDAFLAQPEDVMDAVQRLRKLAQDAGQLKTTEQQKVVVQQAQPAQPSIIIIEPAQPQVVYVPTYNPTVVYGPWPYPAYPPVYIPPPPGYVFGNALMAGIAFGTGLAISHALWGGCHWGWGHSSVNINVNRYNSINVNRQLNVNQTHFTHNSAARKGVPYGNVQLNQKYANNVAGSGARSDYRGRDAAGTDAQRDAARNTLAQRTSDPATRQRLQQQGARTTGSSDRVGAASRDIQPVSARPSDNALSGASAGAAARPQIDRGNASRQAAARPAPQQRAPSARPTTRSQGGQAGARSGGRSR